MPGAEGLGVCSESLPRGDQSLHGRQEAAYELVKGLASKDDKEKLNFIPKTDIRQEDR